MNHAGAGRPKSDPLSDPRPDTQPDPKAEEEGRLREPPAERFAASWLPFDLREEVHALVAEGPPSSRGHRQKALWKHGDATVALFRFERGGELPPHKAAGTVVIHAVEGKLRVGIQEGRGVREHVLGAGQLLVLAPHVEHDIRALEDAVMLLHVHLETPGD